MRRICAKPRLHLPLIDKSALGEETWPGKVGKWHEQSIQLGAQGQVEGRQEEEMERLFILAGAGFWGIGEFSGRKNCSDSKVPVTEGR